MARDYETNILKVDNTINIIPFKGLTQAENNIFYAILYKMQNKNFNIVTLDTAEIKSLVGLSDQNNTYIKNLVTSASKKIASSIVEWHRNNGNTIDLFSIFKILRIDDLNTEPKITAQISEPFLSLINEIKANFTAIELTEFSVLSSKYSQTLYRLLKQYRTTGFLKMDWDKFVEIMDIPKNYRQSDIDKWILKPCIKELGKDTSVFFKNNPIFKGLTYKKIRGKGRGRPVIAIEFYFTPRNATKSQKKSLETIARDIQVKEALKQIKGNTEPKQQEPKQINPLTGKESDWSQEFIGRHIKVKNKFDGGYDTCKIENIQEVEGRGYVVGIRNQENNTTFIKALDNKEHFLNWFKKSLGGIKSPFSKNLTPNLST